MKRTIALMFLLAVVVSGCSRPVVREKETVVERPVPVAPATVVTPAASGATAAAACAYASQAYSHGAVSCQDRNQYRCDNGVWNRTYNAC
jgi:hypothetical protein